MNRTTIAVAAAVLVLVGVFTAIAVSVVDARRSVDTRVSESFDATIAKRATRKLAVSPRGCSKTGPYLFECSALLRQGRRLPAVVNWQLLLRDDGCWTIYATPPYPPPRAALDVESSKLGTVTGCYR